MKSKNILCALAFLGIAAAGLPGAAAADKEKPSTDVEMKVTQVLKEAYPDVIITSMAKETEDGLDVIGVAFTTKGSKIEADVTPDGVLVGTEEAGDIEKFPKPAAQALKKVTQGMKASFEIAKTFAKGEKDASGKMKAVKLAEPMIAYEADVEKDGKKGEFAVNADGKILESPKWAEVASKAKE